MLIAMLIFVGPTAAGKTTLMRSLCRRLQRYGRKCVYYVSEPFGGLAYIVIALLSRLLLYIYRPGDVIGKRRYMAVVEILNSSLLSKLLPLVILLDILSTLSKYAVFMFLERLGFKVLVEDYIPQMMADHLVYSRLYGGNSRVLGFILMIEEKIFASHLFRRGDGVLCIHINVGGATRVIREYARSGDIAYAIGFYNSVVRDLLVRRLCDYVCSRVVYLERL